jgi:hypothetical protein
LHLIEAVFEAERVADLNWPAALDGLTPPPLPRSARSCYLPPYAMDVVFCRD